MIPRLGDGNGQQRSAALSLKLSGLENDSPSRGRKQCPIDFNFWIDDSRLENDSPSRGRKPNLSYLELVESPFRK